MIKFRGDWTEKEIVELQSVITESSEETYCHSDAYNYWTIDKYDDGIWGRRSTWDMGYLKGENYEAFLKAFKDYYRSE